MEYELMKTAPQHSRNSEDPERGDGLTLPNGSSQEKQEDIIEMESVKYVDPTTNESPPIEGNPLPPPEVKEPSPTTDNIILLWFQLYVKKFQGVEGKRPPKMTRPLEMLISSLLAFIGIFLIAVTDHFYLLPTFSAGHNPSLGIQMLTGAYAATSVLIYEAYQSPLAQPRNVFGSYTICSFVGVSTRLVCDIIGIPRYATGAIAVAFAIFFMNCTKTVHPPGGACALIAVIGGEMIEAIGYGYILTSMGAAFIMLCVATMGNNLFPTRQYPLYWD